MVISGVDGNKNVYPILVDNTGKQYVIIDGNVTVIQATAASLKATVTQAEKDRTIGAITETDDDNIAKDQTTLTIINLNYTWDAANDKWVRSVPLDIHDSFDDKNWVYAASDDTIDSDATEYSMATDAYVKKTEFTIPASVVASLFRLRVEMKGDASDLDCAYVRVYKNGAPVSGERRSEAATYTDRTLSVSTTFLTGDTFEIWMRSTAPYTGYIQNIRICGTSSYVEVKSEPTW